MRSTIALIACLAVLALVDFSIREKERQLAEGSVVFLELAPVDPRSLMQGDYMALRFKVANEGLQRDGHVVVGIDDGDIGTFRRLDDGTPLAADEARLRYRMR